MVGFRYEGEHNLSIIGTFVEHNRKIFGAVQHSIIGYFLSIIGSALSSGTFLLWTHWESAEMSLYREVSSFQEPLYCGHLGDLVKCPE